MEIKTPDLGVDSAEVSEIMVAVGDVIAENDTIVLLESDKASVEVPSTHAGTVKGILISNGDVVSEGVVLIDLEVDSATSVAEAAPVESVVEAKPAVVEPVAKASVAPVSETAAVDVTHNLPDLGVDEAEVSEVLVAVGDTVTAEQSILLLESDKASVEVPAPVAGVVQQLLIGAGDTVTNGQAFIIIKGASVTGDTQPVTEQVLAAVESKPVVAEKAPAVAPQVATEATHALPDLGVDEAQVAEILVAVGDEVKADESILLIESDKASVEVPAPVSGKVIKLLVKAGDTVTNGQDFIVMLGSNGLVEVPVAPASVVKPEAVKAAAPVAVAKTPAATPDAKLSESQVNSKLADVYAGPAVRKLARQLGVDITQIKGTAVNSRILKEDLFGYVQNRMKQVVAPVAAKAVTSGGAAASLPKLPDMSKTELWGEIERQPLTRLQKVSIPQLNYNTLIPQVTQFDLSDITDTESFRGTLKAQYKAEGVSLTILSFIIKVTAHALIKFPKFNSHLSDDNTELLIRKTVNMGVAVATPDGLIVPVIKDAQTKSIRDISVEIGELAKKARNKKLSPKDIGGASFTISSLGNMGGHAFTPLVTWPQVGILGISDATIQPRWNAAKGDFEPRLMLPLSLSYDHRVINGADAAIFTRFVANMLADPRKVLLD